MVRDTQQKPVFPYSIHVSTIDDISNEFPGARSPLQSTQRPLSFQPEIRQERDFQSDMGAGRRLCVFSRRWSVNMFDEGTVSSFAKDIDNSDDEEKKLYILLRA